MPYNAPKLSTLIARNQADINSRLPGAYAQKRFSVTGAVAFANAGNAAGLHDHLAWTSRQIIPDLADEDKLLEHGEFWGVWRKLPTFAAGKITVTVIQNTTIPAGTRWQRPDGVVFESTEEVSAPAGVAYVPVVATAEGKDSNTAADTPLELVSPVPGVQSTAPVSSTTISGGSDLESLDSLRARLSFRAKYPPSGGNRFDYVRWALECAGVTRAWSLPRYRGHGTIGVLFVLDGEADIFPTAGDISRVTEYLTGHINPVTNQVEGKTTGAELIVEAPTPRVISPVIRLYPLTDAVKAEVTKNLKGYLATLALGGKLQISDFRATVSNSMGEEDNAVISPEADIYAAENELFVLGDISWL